MIRTFTAIALGVIASAQSHNVALQSLIEAEREFARVATVIGIRDSFLQFFSEDSIAFVPEPRSWVERLRGQVARPFSEHELVWAPRAGDIASSGDFGWLTGPSTFVDRAGGGVPQYGNYLSVWKRAGTGPWKVFIDVGTAAPSAVPFRDGFTHVELPRRYAGGPDPSDATTIVIADHALNAQIGAAGWAAALRSVLAVESRLHRPGTLPGVGRASILELLARSDARATCTAGGSGAARSSDLGYSYGLCTRTGATAPIGYLRIWARDAAARWWLVVDVGTGG